MDTYRTTREDVLKINEEVKGLLGRSGSVLDSNTPALRQWTGACDSVSRHLLEHIVRIAVVGAIKSGKSTLVNSLLKEDYLKRGAGVVTSIVTRLRHGESLRARLFLKSWDDINEEIRRSLVLFPTEEWRSETHAFDIRRGQDRRDLQHALDALDNEMRVVQDSLNANSVLLSSYLNGYDAIRNLVSDENTTQAFEGSRFAEHRAYVSNDALAVYLKDIELEVPSDVLRRNLEMADCQGSDSPNPLHLAMIQDYLLKAHLVVYVISSRTGVRQADIRFLNIIKRMGIVGNMLFVVNCDFNEHEGLNDLQSLIHRIAEELSLIVDSPLLFSVSALYNLFDANPSALSPNEQGRLALWRRAEALVAHSDHETRRLQEALERKLTRERSFLLLWNQVARIDVTLAGLRQWLRLNRDMLDRDAGEARSMADQLQSHQGRMIQVQAMIQSTLDGAADKVGKELKSNVDRFFDLQAGPVLQTILGFVREYQVDTARSKERIAAGGFTHTLYLVFQELRQAVDVFMAEKINPDILGFIHQSEAHLQSRMRLVAEPFEGMVRDALMRYADVLHSFGMPAPVLDWTFNGALDLTSVKENMGLTLPMAAATMNYSANIKTEAVMRLGFYNLVRLLRKALKRGPDGDKAEELRALQDSVRKMKKETERAIIAHFKDYKENIKFQYLLPLTRMAGKRLYDVLSDQFAVYVGDVKALADAMDVRRSDKARVDGELRDIEQQMTHLQTKLKAMRQQLTPMMNSDVSIVESTS